MERLFVGLLPSAEVTRLVTSERKKIGSGQESSLPPHLTIHPPFQTEETERIAELFESIFVDQVCFKLDSVGYGAFPAPKPVIHLAAALSPELSKLRARLLAVTGYRPEFEFHPHLTITRVSAGRVESTLEDLRQTPPPASFLIEEAVLFKENPDKTWLNWRHWNLGRS